MININEVLRIIRKDIGLEIGAFDTSYYSKYMDDMWQWYKGDGPAKYRTYTVCDLINVRELDKAHLSMGKRVCEDNTSLTVNNNWIINIENKDIKEYLLGKTEETNGYLGSQKFYSKVTNLYELTCALGTGAIEIDVEKLKDNGKEILADSDTELVLRKHNGFEILPLTWNGDKDIESVAFLSEKEEAKQLNNRTKQFKRIQMTIHYLTETGYKIYNVLILNDGKTYKLSKLNDSVISYFDTKSKIPMFSILKLNIVNNYNLSSPYGASILANAESGLACADEAFTTFMIELQGGKKKDIIDYSLLPKDETGNLVCDTKNLRNTYITGDKHRNNMDSAFSEFVPTLRIDEISKAIQLSLNLISTKCGLGNNYYKFDAGTLKTATEVISENSACYRNICKNQQCVRDFVISLLKSIVHYTNYFKGTNFDEDFDVSIDFDTSIIEDKAEARKRDLEEVKLGIMSKEEYRRKWYGIPRTSENSSFIKEEETEEKTDDTSSEN